MGRIEWDASFSVHNDAIDDQHKKWLKIFNTLHEVMTDTDTSSLTTITAQSLTEMYDYARNHFRFEEEYLAQLNYPDLVAHRRLHRDFENQVYRYTREIEEGKILLNTNLLKIMRQWLVEHILSEDKKYSAFARQAISPAR